MRLPGFPRIAARCAGFIRQMGFESPAWHSGGTRYPSPPRLRRGGLCTRYYLEIAAPGGAVPDRGMPRTCGGWTEVVFPLRKTVYGDLMSGRGGEVEEYAWRPGETGVNLVTMIHDYEYC